MKELITKFKNRSVNCIKRNGIEELVEYLENKTDFFQAPCSSVYHNSFENGLVIHSLNVEERLIEKRNLGLLKIDLEPIKIVSLFHDVCKINCYESYLRNVKDEKTGSWNQVKSYKWNDKRVVYGHGAESVYIIERFMKLTDEEKFAIRYHMGAFQDGDMKSLNNVFSKYPLAFYLHVADMEATYYDED